MLPSAVSGGPYPGRPAPTPTPMEIDPATICARTGAGETELAQARNGLTLPQRKALSLLAAPRVYAEFAAENSLDPGRLGRDFSRLAELGLITLQLGSVVIAPPARPRADAAPARATTAPRPKAKPVQPPTDAQLRPVVIGAAPARRPLSVALLAGGIAIAVGAGWLALRDDSRKTPRADASVSPALQAQPASPNPPIIVATSASVPPDASPTTSAPPPAVAPPSPPVAQAPRVVAPERPAPARETVPTPNAASARANDAKLAAVAATPTRATPSPVSVVERAPASPAQAPERVPEASVAAALVAPLAASAPAPAPPPVQIASAAKPAVAQLPSVKSALQPVVREAPEFPKEAITEGVTSGIVKARVTLDGSGKVTGIEILDAQPRRVFDRAVRAALWRWQYEPGAPNRTADVEVAFARQ